MATTDAQRAYSRKHYLANRERYIERQRIKNANARKRRRIVVQGEKDKPCMDCGVKYPYYVMQFDHVRGVKLFNIGEAQAWKVSEKRLMAEIAKCDVVCANCHSERTHSRRPE